jgi:hypothetical protein
MPTAFPPDPQPTYEAWVVALRHENVFVSSSPEPYRGALSEHSKELLVKKENERSSRCAGIPFNIIVR